MTRIVSTKVSDTDHAALIERYGTIYKALQHAVRLALEHSTSGAIYSIENPTPETLPALSNTEPNPDRHWHRRGPAVIVQGVKTYHCETCGVTLN